MLSTILNVRSRRVLVATIDFAVVILSFNLSYFFRFGDFVRLGESNLLVLAFGSGGLALVISYYFDLYRVIFGNLDLSFFKRLALSYVLYGTLFFIVISVIGISGIPRTLGVIQPFVAFGLVTICRVGLAYLIGLKKVNGVTRQRALVYGAGSAGQLLTQTMLSRGSFEVVGLIDDDSSLHGVLVMGVRVNKPEKLRSLIDYLAVDVVIIAIPSITKKQRSQILLQLEGLSLPVLELPSWSVFKTGAPRPDDLKAVDLAELISRDVHDDAAYESLTEVANKVVLVTGAGGSIGSELCRQLIEKKPAKLLILDHSEFLLFSICKELESAAKLQGVDLIPILSTVIDREGINQIFDDWCPNYVFHAAAYKHVDIVQQNIVDGIKVNVLGTIYVAQAAAAQHCDSFTLVSTDKAVRPTNVMGATKRLAERVVSSLAGTIDNNRTKFTVVRFGNVVGSSGSVLPLFQQQISAGGPLTITHPRATRFFMTIPEAVSLILCSTEMTVTSSLYVFDMGRPVTILEMAERVAQQMGVSLSYGDNQDGDIDVEIIGLRPGEKMYEELSLGHELLPTDHPKILRLPKDLEAHSDIRKITDEVSFLVEMRDADGLYSLLLREVEGFTSV